MKALGNPAASYASAPGQRSGTAPRDLASAENALRPAALVIDFLPELVFAAPILSLDSGPLGQGFVFLRFRIDENRRRIAPAKAKEIVAAIFARCDGHRNPLASM